MGLVGPAKTLLSHIPGTSVVDLDAGCCGMAGSFGYAPRPLRGVARHRRAQALSRGAGEGRRGRGRRGGHIVPASDRRLHGREGAASGGAAGESASLTRLSTFHLLQLCPLYFPLLYESGLVVPWRARGRHGRQLLLRRSTWASSHWHWRGSSACTSGSMSLNDVLSGFPGAAVPDARGRDPAVHAGAVERNARPRRARGRSRVPRQCRPHPGDVLRARVDHRVARTGERRHGRDARADGDGGRGTRVRSRRS